MVLYAVRFSSLYINAGTIQKAVTFWAYQETWFTATRFEDMVEGKRGRGRPRMQRSYSITQRSHLNKRNPCVLPKTEKTEVRGRQCQSTHQSVSKMHGWIMQIIFFLKIHDPVKLSLLVRVHHLDAQNPLWPFAVDGASRDNPRSARRSRMLRGHPTLGAYESFPDVLIRRGRRKDVAPTSCRAWTIELRSPDAGT